MCLPLDLKRLRRLIAKNEIGTLEIKVRGVDIAPETLRRRFDLRRRASGQPARDRRTEARSGPSWLKGPRRADRPRSSNGGRRRRECDSTVRRPLRLPFASPSHAVHAAVRRLAAGRLPPASA